MSSFLTNDGKTFYGGTYYPRDRFMSLMQQVVKAWDDDQAGILAQAEKISDGVQRYLDQAQTAGELASAAPGLAVKRLKQRHDELYGGFSPAPKFPNEPDYLFLIDYARREADQQLVRLISFDLDVMAQGGIYDQVEEIATLTMLIGWDQGDKAGKHWQDTITLNDFTFTVTPEPATVALLALGGAVMFIRRRR